MPETIIIICGPTASGKTALGVALAERHNGEVVSADSMQIYRGMDIGTAKPTKEEMRGIPHHMLNVADPTEDYSVARYVSAATACVDDILARQKCPIVVGGTGLYIDSLVAGREFAPFTGGWREKLQSRACAEGLAALYNQLQAVDPLRAARLHPNDEKRILRALEVWYETGATITEHDLKTQMRPPRYRAAYLGLNPKDRITLCQRIDRRVDMMLEQGLEEEVQALLAAGVSEAYTAMQAIGYKEMAAALKTHTPIAQAGEEIKLRSRQYAKRQLTWFRRNATTKWITLENMDGIAMARQKATEYLEEFGLS